MTNTQKAPAKTIDVVTIRAVWDNDEKRIEPGRRITLPVKEAKKLIKSQVVDLYDGDD